MPRRFFVGCRTRRALRGLQSPVPLTNMIPSARAAAIPAGGLPGVARPPSLPRPAHPDAAKEMDSKGMFPLHYAAACQASEAVVLALLNAHPDAAKEKGYPMEEGWSKHYDPRSAHEVKKHIFNDNS